MPSLFLHADDPLWQPRHAATLVARLQELGLLGREGEFDGTDGYLAGRNFLQLLMFLGCSPRVTLAWNETVGGQQVCFIRLRAVEEPVFLATRPLPAVRCAQCRASASLSPGFGFATPYRCGECGRTTSAAGLDWRQGAGFGRFFIEVNGIHPQEAIPSDKLLEVLGRFSGCRWKYFFADVPS
jgi:hypothetical protein